MFLKSMEIFGFKSFADRGRIEFTPGITALLGPNGCGKSNVVDAIKWVLGEQASKALRAEHMEDVIFNGTDSRKALNVAEVTLTISNETQVLALDLPEISIKRRLFRSGESEYLINNNPVKLKDVRELFYDTGVGKSAYSVMEQGRIDQILSNKPEERRYLFEEAAGITKFKVRGQEAERRLEKTEENLRQLEGILGEIRHTWESLKRQSEKTNLYRQQKKELFLLEKDQQLVRWKAFLVQRDRAAGHLTALLDQKNTARKLLDDLNLSLEEGMAEVTARENQLVQLQKQILTLSLGKSSVDQQKILQKERLEQYREDARRQELQRQTQVDRKGELEAEKARIDSAFQVLQDDLARCRLNLEEYHRALETARIALADHDAAIALAGERINRLETQDTEWQEALRAITDQLVSELDQRLKDEGFAWHRLPELTNEMEATLRALRVLLQSRQAGDSASALALMDRWEAGWERYKGAIPRFLQDFLSPEGIITQKRGVEERMTVGRTEIKVQKEVIRQRQDDRQASLVAIESYRMTLEDLKVNEVRMQTRLAAVGENAQRVVNETLAVEILLTRLTAEKLATEQKAVSCATDLSRLENEEKDLVSQESVARSAQTSLELDLKTRTEGLVARQSELKQRMVDLNTIQLQQEQHQVTVVRLDTEIRGIHDHFRDKHSLELAEFEAELANIEPGTPEGRDEIQAKKDELRHLGQVNLMAVEEFAEVDERHKFLQTQIEDLKKAREDLRQVTSEIRRESTALFSAAFEQIRENFNVTFRRLFGGGRAELRLTEPSTVLESGIEMLCQPPGKKLESNLLSGGEKSMTAVALLFATFMVRPSPFCILDEIDAALDEANVSRFVAMLSEFSARSQFVVITHNKKTVAGSSTMIGVTMETPGVSKILSVRLVPDANEDIA